MPEAVGADAAAVMARPAIRRALRWGGTGVLLISLGFIGHRLAALDPERLTEAMTWPFAGAIAAATASFALADHFFAKGWATLADREGRLGSRQVGAIYGRGVLMKYLPGSVFQYASRQLEGAGAGLEHKRLAGASLIEVGLHIVASLVVAGCYGLGQLSPPFALAGGAGLAVIALRAQSAVARAFGWQMIAFMTFAVGAFFVGAALAPVAIGLGSSLFAALFLVAWLAGFLVIVAPGGIGVREAALLALAGPAIPAPALLTAVFALRVSSVLGDLGYGLVALARGRSPALSTRA